MRTCFWCACQVKKMAKSKGEAAAAKPPVEEASPAEDRDASGGAATPKATAPKKRNGSKVAAVTAVNGPATEQPAAEQTTEAEGRPTAAPLNKQRKRKRDAAGGRDGSGEEAAGADASPASDAGRAQLQQWAEKLAAQEARRRTAREAMEERIKRAKVAANEVTMPAHAGAQPPGVLMDFAVPRRSDDRHSYVVTEQAQSRSWRVALTHMSCCLTCR